MTHPSRLRRFPSSQSSEESRMPSPQRYEWQSGRQEASGDVELRVPSSHSSPGSTLPSPHEREKNRQFLHWYGREESWEACSHCSPRSFWTMPSPQIPSSKRHVPVQPSSSRRFASSHSSEGSRMPLPQTGAAATRRTVERAESAEEAKYSALRALVSLEDEEAMPGTSDTSEENATIV